MYTYLTLLSKTLVRNTSSWSRFMVQKVQRSLWRFGPETGPRFLASPAAAGDKHCYYLKWHKNKRSCAKVKENQKMIHVCCMHIVSGTSMTPTQFSNYSIFLHLSTATNITARLRSELMSLKSDHSKKTQKLLLNKRHNIIFRSNSLVVILGHWPSVERM